MSDFMDRAEDLKTLLELSQKICDEAYEKRQDIKGAINWGDLGPSDAIHCQDVSGRTYFRVIVEECAPEAAELRDFIYHRLCEEGWQNVDVDLEW